MNTVTSYPAIEAKRGNAMNENIEYEKLVQKIFQGITDQNIATNIEVEHNRTLTGLKGSHQIDVYWKFNLNGVEYQTAIECKNYKSPIDIGKIRAFNDTLNDIQNINGVFVAKSGFQSGAIEYAKNSKIKLLELREQTDEDWVSDEKDEDGNFIPLIKTIVLNFTIVAPRIEKIEFDWDMKWIAENTGMKKGDTFSYSISGEAEILDKNDNIINNLNHYFHQITKEKDTDTASRTFNFDEAYIYCNETKLKFCAMTMFCKFSTSTNQMTIDGGKMVSHILKNVLTGEWNFVDIDGNVRGEVV